MWVMPGIASLADKDFLLAFARVGKIIQNRHPVFTLVKVGSIVSVVWMLVLGTLQLTGLERYLMWFADLMFPYMEGVESA